MFVGVFTPDLCVPCVCVLNSASAPPRAVGNALFLRRATCLFIRAASGAAVGELGELVLDPFDGAGRAGCRVVGGGIGGVCAATEEGYVGFEGWRGEAGFTGAVLRVNNPADGGEDDDEEEEEEEEAPAVGGRRVR